MRIFIVPFVLLIFIQPLYANELVFLFDGTWNNSIDYEGSRKWLKSQDPPLSTSDKRKVSISATSTNIARMFHLLEQNDTQKTFYIRGVGTGERDSFIGGAFGKGSKERMELALDLLKQNYKEGDEIYIFGYSRGAATARQFARKIDSGIPIRFMGLLDTVAAFGMPSTKFGLDGFSKEFPSFFNKLEIPTRVKTVVHLVALDEDRQVFLPTLISKEPVNTESRKEIWFRGNHGDIGGGWPDEDEPEKPFRRRQITLRYMLEQNHGLKLRGDWKADESVKVDSNRRGKPHGQEDYDFKSKWGGEQRRVHVAGSEFPIPYNPTAEVIYSPN